MAFNLALPICEVDKSQNTKKLSFLGLYLFTNIIFQVLTQNDSKLRQHLALPICEVDKSQNTKKLSLLGLYLFTNIIFQVLTQNASKLRQH